MNFIFQDPIFQDPIVILTDIFTYKKISNYDHIEWHMHKSEKNPSKNDLELYNSPEKLRLEWVLN